MTTLFISDLHLSENHPQNVNWFFQFLQQQAIHADALYILGDLFNVWVGDDDHSPFHQSCITALKTLTDLDIPVYFIHGNRDFLIGRRFAKASGCRLLTEPYFFQLYGTPTLLMHGDTLCTEDLSYLRFRKIIRSWPVKLLFKIIPLSRRKKIAARAREGSSKHMQSVEQHITDASSSEIQRVIQQYQAKLLIHGHTHRPAINLYWRNEQLTQRIVLSDWHQQGNVLVCKSSGERELVYFS